MKALNQIDTCLNNHCILFALFTLHVWHYFNLQIFPLDDPSELFHPILCNACPNKLNKFIPTKIYEIRCHFILLGIRLIINPHKNIFSKGLWRWDFDEPYFIKISIWHYLLYVEISKWKKHYFILRLRNFTDILSCYWLNVKKSIVMSIVSVNRGGFRMGW